MKVRCRTAMRDGCQDPKDNYFPPDGAAVVVAFFFLPFDAVLLVLFDVDFVVAGFSSANTAIPLSSDRPSIRLIIFFMCCDLLDEVLVTSTISTRGDMKGG
jgi:hypothetical protein